MSKIDEVRSEMVAAMKAKDKNRKDALSAILTALKNVAIDKRADLTEEEENTVVMKEMKQMKETMESAPADRTDIIEECRFRLSVYQEFAPKLMSKDEVEATINDVLSELGITEPTAKDKGKIMKTLMPKVKGKADNSMVNEVLSSILQ